MFLFLCALTSAVLFGGLAFAEEGKFFETAEGNVIVQKVSGPFSYPWAIGFLPGEKGFLVSERVGRMRLVENGKISPPIFGLPQVKAEGQGGLMDVLVDPEYEKNNRIFWTFSEPTSEGKSRTTLGSGTLNLSASLPKIENVKVIFRQRPAVRATVHYGSRIFISNKERIFLTLGDRGNRDQVQNLTNHFGKIVRINRDGSVPRNNPFVRRRGALPEIWSIGHRNPQGAAGRHSDGVYFTISHGAAGGDEINTPQSGRNYGWPEVSFGTHYSGKKFPASVRHDVVPPLYYWDPSIAPSGAAFYRGDLFPKWNGNLFVGALRGQMIVRLIVEGDDVWEAERLLEGQYGRIRDVRSGPDGAIWFCTDNIRGAVYRIIPAPD